MAKVSWLHISDMHILRPTDTPGAEAFNQEQVLDRFVDFMAKRFPDDRIERPQYFFVTGDLAFRGKREDYEDPDKPSVRKSIDVIAGVMGIRQEEYKDRVFPVPGNHDIDRESLKYSDLEPEFSATDSDVNKLNDLFINPDKQTRKGEILSRSKAYCDFVRGLWGLPSSATDEEVLWYDKSLGIEDSTEHLHVVGLNSAWLCHSYWRANIKGKGNDNASEPIGHLTLCEVMVEKHFKDIPKGDMVITLMHHDYDLTHDRNTAVQHLLESTCDFILLGHEHTERWATPTGGRAHKIRTGCFYERRGWRNAVNVVEVDVDAGQAKMLTIHYRPDQGGFWAVDRDRDPSGGESTYVFEADTGLLKFSVRSNTHAKGHTLGQNGSSSSELASGPDRGYERKVRLAENILTDCRRISIMRLSFFRRVWGVLSGRKSPDLCHGSGKAPCMLPHNSTEFISHVALWEKRIAETLELVQSMRLLEELARDVNISPGHKDARQELGKVQRIVKRIRAFLKESGASTLPPAVESEGGRTSLLNRAEFSDIRETLRELVASLDAVEGFVKSGQFGQKAGGQGKFEQEYVTLLTSLGTLQRSLSRYAQEVLSREYEGFSAALVAFAGKQSLSRKDSRSDSGETPAKMPIREFMQRQSCAPLRHSEHVDQSRGDSATQE